MKNGEIVQKDGKTYLHMNGQLAEVTGFKEGEGGRRIPIIKAMSEVIKRPDGSVDVVVHVPCLKIAPAVNP